MNTRRTNDTGCGGGCRLEDRQAISLPRLSPSSSLACTRGTIWITLEGDHADYILSAGERLVMGNARRPVISAIGEAEFSVLCSEPVQSPPGGVSLQLLLSKPGAR